MQMGELGVGAGFVSEMVSQASLDSPTPQPRP